VKVNGVQARPRRRVR